jgi:hypothetical protein
VALFVLWSPGAIGRLDLSARFLSVLDGRADLLKQNRN